MTLESKLRALVAELRAIASDCEAHGYTADDRKEDADRIEALLAERQEMPMRLEDAFEHWWGTGGWDETATARRAFKAGWAAAAPSSGTRTSDSTCPMCGFYRFSCRCGQVVDGLLPEQPSGTDVEK